ncbi:MAG: hypothetical protein WCL21_02605 [Mariniphaga sp.]
MESLTFEAMESGGLRATFLSNYANAPAGDKTTNLHSIRHFL